MKNYDAVVTALQKQISELTFPGMFKKIHFEIKGNLVHVVYEFPRRISRKKPRTRTYKRIYDLVRIERMAPEMVAAMIIETGYEILFSRK